MLEETIAHSVKECSLAENVNVFADDVIHALEPRGPNLIALGLSRESLESKSWGQWEA